MTFLEGAEKYGPWVLGVVGTAIATAAPWLFNSYLKLRKEIKDSEMQEADRWRKIANEERETFKMELGRLQTHLASMEAKCREDNENLHKKISEERERAIRLEAKITILQSQLQNIADVGQVVGSRMARIVVQSDGKIMDAEGFVFHMFGYKPTELVGKKAWMLVPPSLRSQFESMVGDTKMGTHPAESVLVGEGISKEGESFGCLLYVTVAETSEAQRVRTFTVVFIEKPSSS